MPRQNRLGRTVNARRWGRHVSALPAEDLYKRGYPPVTGTQVATAYGFLAHYTTMRHVNQALRAGHIGGGAGCWLTPSDLAACMVPYDLGLNTPRDVCVLVDVGGVAALWGPGTIPPSTTYRSIWRGGGIEFYAPQPLSASLIRQVVPIDPCGDRR